MKQTFLSVLSLSVYIVLSYPLSSSKHLKELKCSVVIFRSLIHFFSPSDLICSLFLHGICFCTGKEWQEHLDFHSQWVTSRFLFSSLTLLDDSESLLSFWSYNFSSSVPNHVHIYPLNIFPPHLCTCTNTWFYSQVLFFLDFYLPSTWVISITFMVSTTIDTWRLTEPVSLVPICQLEYCQLTEFPLN